MPVIIQENKSFLNRYLDVLPSSYENTGIYYLRQENKDG